MEKTDKEILESLPAVTSPDFKLLEVRRCNFKPHPYTIGTRHVAHAADNCGGMLGQETCEKIPCAVPGCQVSYADHVSDRVLFIKALRDCPVKDLGGLQDYLASIKKALIESGVDGVAFVAP